MNWVSVFSDIASIIATCFWVEISDWLHFSCRRTLSMCVSVTNIMPDFEDQEKISGCILPICYCFFLFIDKKFFASSMLCLVLSLCLISPLTIKVMDVWKSLATIRHCGQEQEEDREVRVWQDDTTDRDLRQALEEDLERADHHCCKAAKTAVYCCRWWTSHQEGCSSPCCLNH